MNKRSFTYSLIFIALTSMLYPDRSEGQEYPYQNILVNTFGIEKGLNASTINALLMDSEGLLWIGTIEGLNRFDGHEFKLYGKTKKLDDDAILGNVISQIKEDKNGRIWIATLDGGISIFNKEQQTFKHLINKPDDPGSLTNNAVINLFLDDEFIWAGTYWGLSKININTFEITNYYFLDKGWTIYHNQIIGIQKDENDILWLGTKQGLLSLDPIENVLKMPSDIKKDHLPIKSLAINNIYITNDQILYITHDNGLSQVDLSTMKASDYSSNQILSGLEGIILFDIVPDQYGKLLLATDGYGVVVFDPATKNFRQLSEENKGGLSNLSIRRIYLDKDGKLWLGSSRKGLKLISQFNKKFYLYQKFDAFQSNKGKNVIAFEESAGGKIWIATYREGLYEFDPLTKTFQKFKWKGPTGKKINENVIKCMQVDEKDNLYLGTYKEGLYYIDFENDKITQYLPDPLNPFSINNSSVWDIEIDQNGKIWLGTLGGGLNMFDPLNNKFYHLNTQNAPSENWLTSDYVSRLIITGQNEIWLGTIGGGFSLFNPSDTTFINYLKEDDDLSTPSYNEVIDIFEDSKKSIWVGSKGGGLFKLDRSKNQLTQYPFIDKKEISILSIEEDESNNFWLGTYQGLIKFDPRLNTTTIFDTNDGIQGKEFSSKAKLKSKQGLLYFGGSNGFNEFNPQEINVSNVVPKVLFTDFLLFNKPVNFHEGIINKHINYADQVNLLYSQKVFSIEFAAMDYTFPKRNQFSYLLEGFDKDWNFVSHSNLATYTNIPPGSYVFKVKASNYDGVWGDNIKSIKINILPPWYQLQWVQFLIISLITLIIVLFIWIRTRYIYRQKKILEEIINRRIKDIKSQKATLESNNKKLNIKNEKIRETNEQITFQNEELKYKNSELTIQREQLAIKSELLEKAHSELKEANRELLNVNQNLEMLVHERTRELEDTLEKLIKSDDGINTFLYKSSHDLRGPITTLLGLTHLVKFETKEPQIIGYIEKIERTCFTMLQFLKKLNETHVIFRIHKINRKIQWKAIFHDIKLQLKNIFRDINFTITFDLKLKNKFESDPDLIKTIILNLSENILTTQNNEKSVLKIKIHQLTDNIVFEFFYKKDKNELDNEIFDLLNRPNKIYSESGLGLFLAHRAVEILDGELQYSPSEHIIFRVLIPIIIPDFKRLVNHINN